MNKELSNQELNLALCKILNPKAHGFKCSGSRVRYSETWHGIKLGRSVDYCNDLNLLMPLCWEHGISGVFTKGKYAAYRYLYDADDNTPTTQAIDKSPQLALAECLLKVLTEKEKNGG